MKTSTLVLTALGFFALGACTKTPVESAREITPREVMGMMANSFAVVVDVREADERAQHIDKALWMPDSQITNDSADWKSFVMGLSKDKTVVFHCGKGVRARKAADRLAALGFKTAYFEGIEQWQGAGLPVVKNTANAAGAAAH